MKFWWMLLLVPALPTASIAAGGLNLAWNNCYPSIGAAQDQSFICDDSSPETADANTQVFLLYGSVIPGIDIHGLIAWGATLDLAVKNPTLDDWWRLAPGECRGGTADTLTTISFAFRQFTNPTACNRKMMDSDSTVEVSNWYYPAGKPANHARYSFAVVRYGSSFNVAAVTQYQLFRVAFDSRNTKLDPAGGTTTACAGCLEPACLALTEVELVVPAAQQPPDGKNLVTWPDQRQFVTWQGGAIGGSGCPGEVPVRRTTWGELKSMYR